MTENGLIYTFKLVHKTGSLSCKPIHPASYWGCTHPWFQGHELLTVITYPNKTALQLADYLRDGRKCGMLYHAYHIDGIGVDSTELVFNNLSPPMSVSIGQMFQIWCGEDLHDCYEGDNSGQTCADVYAWYATD